jgi:hypothetical protein
MRRFCTPGMVLCISLGWTVATAQAQSGNYGAPSLLPLPTTAPLASSSTAASYIGTASTASTNGSYFADDQQPTPPPEAGQSQPLIGGLQDEPNITAFDGCGGCSTCNSSCGGTWFGSFGGLAMGRSRANPYWTTYETNNNVNQLMNTQNAGANWAGGGQFTVGKFWCGCGCVGTGIAFSYWGLAPMTGFSSITDPNNNLSTPINLLTQTGTVNIGSTPAGFFFNNSHSQAIWRDDYVNNFEVNLLAGSLINTGRFQLFGLTGFRYFRFAETLTYGAVAFGHNWGDNGGADEAYLGFRCVNNLFGWQVGAIGNYMLTQRWGVFFIPKVGLYANQMNCQTLLYSGDGQQGVGFPVSAHKSDFAFLGELDAGLNYAFTPNIRAYFGYRVIGVANVALADNQFLPYLADTAGFGQVKQNGGLFLQGGFAGIAYAF